MKMKKIVALICAVACILGCFAGCGKQGAAPTEEAATQAPTEAVTETTAPQISEETKLIMELMGNYLNMEPKREFIEYNFGLTTLNTDLPVAQYDDYAYSENGEAAYSSSSIITNGGYVNVYVGDKDVKWKADYAGIYHNPEIFNVNDNQLGYVEYLYQNEYGIHIAKNSSSKYISHDLVVLNEAVPVFYAFSVLPEYNFKDYMESVLKDPNETKKIFNLSEEDIKYMHELQEWEILSAPPTGKTQAEGMKLAKEFWEDFNKKVESGEYVEPQKHNCYTVSYEIDSEYQNENNPKMIYTLFQQFMVQGQASDYGDSLKYAKTRLDSGKLRVTLYFDKDTKQCVMEKIDATECARPMMEYLPTIGSTKAGDNTFVIKKHYSDTGLEKMPEKVELDSDTIYFTDIVKDKESYKNKIVYDGNIDNHTGFEVAKLDKYEVRYDLKHDVYQIWDADNMVAVVSKYYFDNGLNLTKENLISNEEKNGYTITVYNVPMAHVFESNNQNNNKTGYIATAINNEAKNIGFNICSWDEAILRDVVDHMTFVHTDDPAAA